MKKREDVPYGDLTELDQEENLPFFATHTGKTVSALLMVAIVILILAIGYGSGSVAYEMDSVQLAVVGLDQAPIFVPYDTITDVELVETFRMDKTVDAADWDSGWCGTYENEDYGTFTLCAYSSPGLYIVVKHNSGVLIFNAKNAGATRNAYEKLLRKLDTAGS